MPDATEERLRGLIRDDPAIRPHRLFGCLAAWVEGRVVAMASEGTLSLRLPAADRAEILGLPGTSTLTFRGAHWRGWVSLPAWILEDPEILVAWWNRATGRDSLAAPDIVDEVPEAILSLLFAPDPAEEGDHCGEDQPLFP